MLQRVSCAGKEPGRLVKWMVSFVLSWEEGPGQHRLLRALTALGWGTSGSWCAGIPAGDGTQPLASLLRADGSWEAWEKMLQPKWLICALLCCPNLVAGLGRGFETWVLFWYFFFCSFLGVFVSFWFFSFSSFALEHLLFFTYRSAPLEDFFFFFFCNFLILDVICFLQNARISMQSLSFLPKGRA